MTVLVVPTPSGPVQTNGHPIARLSQLLRAGAQAFAPGRFRRATFPTPSIQETGMTPWTPLDHLREKLWLKSLPDSIDVPTGPGSSPVIAKRIADATVDDIAFATEALFRQSTALHRRADALRQIHDLARRAGAVGTANATAAAARAVDIVE